MTRANVEIIVGAHRAKKFYFQSNSSAYPSYMLEFVVKAVQSTYSQNKGAIDKFYTDIEGVDLSELVGNCDLRLGKVGNPSYYYIMDFHRKRLIVRESQSYWVNAPYDWREKGWVGCYKGSNGRYGYDGIRKGKIIFDAHFSQLVGERGRMKTVKVNPEDNIFEII
jgi:hypothetical protein